MSASLLIALATAHRALAESGDSRDSRELASMPDDELLAVHDALDDLARTDAQAATLVKLRFFGGMTMAEAADAVGLPVRTAQDVWAYARSWLRSRMRPQ